MLLLSLSCIIKEQIIARLRFRILWITGVGLTQMGSLIISLKSTSNLFSP